MPSSSRVEELPDDYEGPSSSSQPAAVSEEEKRRREEEAAKLEACRMRQLEGDMAGDSVDLEAATRLKEAGNAAFKAGDLDRALELYDGGIRRAPFKAVPEPPAAAVPTSAGGADGKPTAPPLASAEGLAACEKSDSDGNRKPDGDKEADEKENVEGKSGEGCPGEDEADYTVTSQLYCNSGFVMMKREQYEDAVVRLDEAVRHDGKYAKAYNRRAACHWELQHYSQCHGDLEQCEGSGMPLDAEQQRRRVASKQKMDEEMQKMMGQLKDLGNMFLGKFGLSTDNFKFKKDETTGSYNVNFVQGQQGGDNSAEGQ